MAVNTTDNAGKEKALNMVLSQIERTFGKGTIMRLGDASRMKVENHLHWRAHFGLGFGRWFTKRAGN